MNNKTSYTLQITDEYGRFNHIGANRNVDPRHVKSIKNSIKEHGVLINPVLVNGNMQIVDGQHRFQACKELKKPVYYLDIGDYGIKEVQALNLSQKNWTQKDYAESFAEMGAEHYQTLLDFYKEMEEFTFLSCIRILQGSTSLRNISQKRANEERRASGVSNQKQVFEEGTWEVDDLERAYKWIDYLREVGKYYDGYKRTAFINAMIGLFNKPQFDKHEFLRKLSYQANALNDCSNVGDYVELIEEIYNFKKRDKVNLRY